MNNFTFRMLQRLSLGKVLNIRLEKGKKHAGKVLLHYGGGALRRQVYMIG